MLNEQGGDSDNENEGVMEDPDYFHILDDDTLFSSGD